jgi:hypothetical protein
MKLRFFPLMLLAGAIPAAAQDAGPLAGGDKVRVTRTGAGRFQATVLEVQPGALLVRIGEGGPQRIELSGLQRLEVARGRRGHVLQGALIGFLPGFALGAYAGNALGCDDQGPDCTDVGAAVAAGLMLGGVTAVAGGLVGLAVRGDRWKKVDLPAGRTGPQVGAALAPVPRGVGARVTLSF